MRISMENEYNTETSPVTIGYPAIAIKHHYFQVGNTLTANMTVIPAGIVATSPGPGTPGMTRASKLFVFKAASIPRVVPNSLLKARASKNLELRPVVASLFMRLDTVN
jgi:hypothetical protein